MSTRTAVAEGNAVDLFNRGAALADEVRRRKALEAEVVQLQAEVARLKADPWGLTP